MLAAPPPVPRLLVAVCAWTLCACGPSRSENPPADAAVLEPASSPGDSITALGSMEARLVAEDYDGALAAYDASPELQSDPHATFLAGIAAALPGHASHDRARARRLLEQLLVEHPTTRDRPAAELLLGLLTSDAEQRRTVARLRSELEQLKAIDLGVEPSPDPGP